MTQKINKYNIRILDEAKDDMKKIIIYIKTELKEPEIARQHRKAFREEISKLKDSANIYNIIDSEITGKSDIRKINIKNFMIFYRIIEDIKEVQVIAVYYSGSNWQKNVKYR